MNENQFSKSNCGLWSSFHHCNLLKPLIELNSLWKVFGLQIAVDFTVHNPSRKCCVITVQKWNKAQTVAAKRHVAGKTSVPITSHVPFSVLCMIFTASSYCSHSFVLTITTTAPPPCCDLCCPLHTHASELSLGNLWIMSRFHEYLNEFHYLTNKNRNTILRVINVSCSSLSLRPGAWIFYDSNSKNSFNFSLFTWNW